MGMVLFGLLPLPGLLAVTAFLFGLVMVLVIHARRGRPWGSILVRAGVALVAMWLAVSAGTMTLMHRLTSSGPVDDGYAADAARALLVLFALVTVLLLVLAGGLLAWIASASQRQVEVAPLDSRHPA